MHRPAGPASFPVWDPLVRVLHWSLVAAVLTSWLTRRGFGATHEWLGYIAWAVVALRLGWGFGPSRYARFGQFSRSPAHTARYARAMVRGRQRRYLGHNPLGGWMSWALWAVVFGVCASGWLYTTDRFWGIEWVERLHAGLTDVLLVLVAVHLLGVVWTSLHERENLLAAMFHGRKRAPGEDDVA